MAGHIVNVAGYRFVAIDDRDRLQAVLRSLCTDLGLKGTVLLAPEGINFFLAGPQAAIEGFTTYLTNRIMQAVFGDERYYMEMALGYAELLDALPDIEEPDEALAMDLRGRRPVRGRRGTGSLFRTRRS